VNAPHELLSNVLTKKQLINRHGGVALMFNIQLCIW